MNAATIAVPTPVAGRRTFDAIIVGAGFAGLYMLHRLRVAGLSVLAIEAGGDVGGTWYWNRYPGARCDVPSVDYSFSFDETIQNEWAWSEKFATQPEILSYLNFVADRLDLRSDILFETRVTAAAFEEEHGLWQVSTDTGGRFEARFCIMASGCLSVPKTPAIPGMDDFGGRSLFTGRWPHDPVDFTGKRVAVIGTGSTGIQIIPEVAGQADHLVVLQRTPSFTLPARNQYYKPGEFEAIRNNYPDHRARARQSPNCGLRPLTDRKAFSVDAEERRRIYDDVWEQGGITFGGSFGDLLTDEAANRTAADFVRSKIDEIVDDPVTAEKLKPYHYPIGTRRICLDTDFYATFNLPNVNLVDAKADPIVGIETGGIRTRNEWFPVDVIVYATGFDAMTGALLSIDIRGREGKTLREKWVDGPVSYLGVSISGFPNFFTITGPGSPSVLSNMVASIEQHVEWIGDLIVYMRARDMAIVDAEPDAESEWVAHVADVASNTLLPQSESWYTGANIPGKPRVFLPYVGGCYVYRQKCDAVAADSYRGFRFSKLEAPA